MVDDILVKVDRASMLHSLEVRSPFLDTELVRFTQSLPMSLKFNKGRTKHILKQALLEDSGSGPLLSPRIVHRKKKGFGIPTARWIRRELRETFRRLLLEDWPADSLPMIDRREVRNLWEAHVSRRENHAKELWALSMLAMWTRQREGSETSLAPINSAASGVE